MHANINGNSLLREHGILLSGNASGFDLHFSLDSLDALDATEDRHFWSVVKRRLITSLIKRYAPKNDLRILDVGCGNGGLLMSLERAFPAAFIAGMDGYPQALLHCRKRSARATLILGDILHVERIPIAEKFDVVILADVLEHLDEPEKVLRGIRSILTPRGIVIATVPASMALWSDRDVFLGHRKRYDRRGLKALFQQSDFRVLRSNYAFCYLYPPAFFFRKLWSRFGKKSGQKIEESELREIPVINTLLRFVGSAEVALSERIPLPFGTSTYCVARLK